MGSVLGFPGIDPADAAIGRRLKHWRQSRGMALDELAGKIGMTPEEIRLAEAGRAHLTSLQIGAATQVLHLPLWALQSDTPVY